MRHAGGLAWRLDQTQSSTTTKRQLAALGALDTLQAGSGSEILARYVVVGGPGCGRAAAAPNGWARYALAMWQHYAGVFMQKAL